MSDTNPVIRPLRVASGNLCRLVFYVYIPLLILAVIFNCVGWKKVNLVIGCILPIIIIWSTNYLVLQEKVMAALLGLGMVDKGKGLLSAATNFVKGVGYVLLVQSLFFLVIGTLEIKQNPTAVLMIFSALLALSLMSVMWGIKIVVAKKIMYTYGCCVLVIGIGSMLDPIVFTRMGFDPYKMFRVTDQERSNVKFIQNIKDEQDKRIVQDMKDSLVAIKSCLSPGHPERDEAIGALRQMIIDSSGQRGVGEEVWLEAVQMLMDASELGSDDWNFANECLQVAEDSHSFLPTVINKSAKAFEAEKEDPQASDAATMLPSTFWIDKSGWYEIELTDEFQVLRTGNKQIVLDRRTIIDYQSSAIFYTEQRNQDGSHFQDECIANKTGNIGPGHQKFNLTFANAPAGGSILALKGSYPGQKIVVHIYRIK